ncbi:cellulase family glycosylhydrolase [Fibrella aquatilis]|uniref:Cellulase family glycosylhydrolase n=1 Tax=Fibrella aquatilis TaxID=2817059 RepID=A0A939G5U9_9BACT|nr:cellulase family glycosylhydrolase [Fibrella aquatilis]MBO0930591.1 cellulase family glycosylhydrolase [Fibrella aquatilis]
MIRFTTRFSLISALFLSVFSGLMAQSPTPVAANGQLKVLNRQLCNAAGNPVQLRGMSSHGLQWFGNCYSQASVQALATQWGADVFRAAMYVDEGGYLSNKTGIQAQVDQLVDWTGQAGIYCIIDWHVLNPGDPNVHLSDAKAFFGANAQKHAGKKHVIYEICNEPNGVDWNTVKAYADQVIPVIRQYDSQAIILVGTPTWSGTPGDVRANPLTGANAANVLYTFHFYAGSHYTQAYMDDVMKTLPIFVSEWGTSNYSGNGGNDYTNAQKWLDLFAGQNTSGQKVSWCNWSFADKAESSAALNPGACGNGGWNNTSESGTWVKNHLLSPADSWATTTPPPPGNQAPTVALSSPANNATFTAPATVALTANAADADGTVAKVEFFSGATKLGESLATPYAYNWTNVTAGTYALTAKATDNKGATTTSATVTITIKSGSTPPPPPPTGDLLGADCARINDIKSYTLSAAKMTNATAFSWWVNGSTQSITPTQPGRATINFGPSFTGGQVCVGVNYSVSPWYQQICKSVTVCAPGARIAAAETADNVVYPNPTRDQFSFTTERSVQAMTVVDLTGKTHLRLGTAKADQTITFGETLPSGVYVLRIQYDTQRQRTVKLLKSE